MDRLIKSEVLDKYLVKSRMVNGVKYEIVFEYVEADSHPKDEDGEDLAHLVRVGFRSEELAVEHIGNLYLPMVMPNGFLTKNKSSWYRVNMLVPPVVSVTGSNLRYLNSVVNTDTSASSLNDFFPELESMRFNEVSPLVKAMVTAEAMDISNLENWNAITADLALIELFNVKIAKDIERSQKGGYLGISGSVKALHTMLRAFIGYCRDEDDESCQLGSHPIDEVDEDEIEVGAVRVVDKLGSILLHPVIKDISINPGGPVDFCSGSQSKPIRTARIRDGYVVEGFKLVKKYDSDFPYAQWRRSVVGIMADDPRRVIVSRGISRSLRISEPNDPLVVTDVKVNISSLSLPGVRMTHPLNHEDGLVVSETFARKMGAFKTCVDRLTIPKPVTVWAVKKPMPDYDPLAAMNILQRMWSAERNKDRECGHHIIRRGDLLASIQYKELDGTIQTKEIRTKVKSLGIVSKVEKFSPADDIPEERVTYRFTSLVYFPLSVGDKVSDAHGNKATISAIWPDENMPVWHGDHDLAVSAHYIATPYVMKRLAMGAEIEDKLALIAYNRRRVSEENEYVATDSLAAMTIADVDNDMMLIQEEEGLKDLQYTGRVVFQDKEYQDVPLSLRAMYRLDNNSREALCGRERAEMDDFKRISKNARLGIDIVTMLSRGAIALVNQLIEKSGSRTYLNKTVVPILHAIQGNIPEGAGSFEISSRLERTAIGNPISHEELAKMDLNNTACDPRIATMYGFIKVGRTRVIVPPNQAIQDLGKGSVTFSRISVYANRVFSEQFSRDRGYEANVERQVKRYNVVLASLVTGKSGLMRDALLPIFPTTIRAVASSRLGPIGEDPLTIAVPRREFNRLKREHPGMETVYGDHRSMYCLLKRDPVHRTNNVIAVPFVLHDYDTIGISPLIIGSLDGDFDGDALFAMFPTDNESYKDLAKLKPDIHKVITPSKMIFDVDPEKANEEIRNRIGWASTFDDNHESDILKNPELYANLYNGMSPEERFAECLKAAKDFEVIKDGTARTGALGLSFIFSRKPEQKHLIDAAMELYHVLAQNTLDAKAGVAQPALEVVAGVSSGNEKLIRSSLAKLNFNDEECITEFVEFAKIQKASGGRMRMLEKSFPVLAITQRAANTNCAYIIADKVARSEKLGDGIWEALTDYLLGNIDNSPYDWADKSKVMTEKTLKLKEILSGKG